MRRWICCSAVLALLSFYPTVLRAAAYVSQSTDRQTFNFNRDWLFSLGDHPGAEAPAYNDHAWEKIFLPHSFSLPYFRAAEFYVGYGWYRKHFEVKPGWSDKRLFLEFDGAFQDAEVFVNGRRVGGHRGGYTGFSFDITGAVRTGSNLVAVRLNNNWNARIAPRAGEHEFCGGIYRDVRLVILNPLHVTWYGTFVSTPRVSAESANVNVKTEVRNDAHSSKKCTVVTTIVDPNGQQVTEMRSTEALAPGSTVTFDQTSQNIEKPKLWHPDHPYLYSIYTHVFDGGRAVDNYQSPLGFRWFKWTAEDGFFLNGEHYYLRGANVHQDHAGWGIAVTHEGMYRDVKLIKEAGFNFIRGSHYPHDPAFVEACDKLGIIFWSENPFWGKGGFDGDGYWNASAYPIHEADFEPFEESCKQELREMIRIDRNHPSIVVWSMTNEAFFTDNVDRAKNLVRSLVQLSHQLDPTRPAAVGGAQRKGFDRLGDVAGYNGDGARLFVDPGIPNMVSEYGAINKGMPGDYAPYFGDLQQQQFPWRSGQAIWCGFDYGTIAGKQGFKGIIDYFRVPKRSWYWYRNAYRHISPPEWPAAGTPIKLQLSADKRVIHGTNADDDVQIIVKVLDASGRQISNSPPVTLAIDSGPGQFPTGSSITFEPQSPITIADGEAAIELRSYYAGRTVVRATSPNLQDATLTITTEGEPVYVAGKTPPVRPRPYLPEAVAQLRRNLPPADVSLDRPSRASTEPTGHPARSANDGDETTSWRAAKSDHDPWWQVDLEGFYNVSQAKLLFAPSAVFRYKIEISKDGHAWTTAIDRTAPSNGASHNDTFPPGTVARYVRISFDGLPEPAVPGLAEVTIFGTLAVQ